MRDKSILLATVLERALNLPGPGQHEPHHYLSTNGFNLNGANLEGLRLQGVDLTEVCFDNAILVGAELIHCNLSRCTFRNADLTRAILWQSLAPNANFEGAILRNANFKQVNLQSARFEGASYAGINLDEAHIRGTVLERERPLVRLVDTSSIDSPQGVIENPFTPQRGKIPHYLGGRDEAKEMLVDGLNITIRGGVAHTLVIGKYAIGKTALLKSFIKEIDGRDVRISYVRPYPYPETNTIRDTARSFINLLNAGFRPEEINKSDIAQQKDKKFSFLDWLRQKFKDHFREWELKPPFIIVKFKPHLPPEERLLRDTITTLWKNIKEKSLCILIVIDDVHETSPFVPFLKLLRSAIDELEEDKVRVMFILASTPKKWEEHRETRYTPPFRDYESRRIDLNELSDDESRMVITETLKDSGVTFTEDVIENAVSYAGGNPYDIQFICARLFALQRGRKVTMNEWEIAHKRAVENEEKRKEERKQPPSRSDRGHQW